MIVRGEGVMTLAGSLAVLLAIGAVGIVLTSMLFRWEGTEPIPRRSLAMIATAFTLTLGVSALAAPAFKMSDMPGARRVEAGDRRRARCSCSAARPSSTASAAASSTRAW